MTWKTTCGDLNLWMDANKGNYVIQPQSGYRFKSFLIRWT
jgi:hypothetical protein